MYTAELKQFMKKSQTITDLYRSANFFASAPIRDIFDIEKARVIRTARPYTMLSWRELSSLYDAAYCLEHERIPGNIVECGVCNGGSSGVLATVVEPSRAREVWMFDSWEGLPEPTESDVSCLGEKGEKGICLGSEQKVRELFFRKLHLSARGKHFVKGWFQDSIPGKKTEIGKIALLHLDGDWYESVKYCLDELYDQVVPGGFVFIDDYGYWEGARKAVDEFLASRNIDATFQKVDTTAAYFRKP
jgi:O-methyltransferase